jgi:hypothetical protein
MVALSCSFGQNIVAVGVHDRESSSSHHSQEAESRRGRDGRTRYPPKPSSNNLLLVAQSQPL